MKKIESRELVRQDIEELLFHALRAIYLFERIEIEEFDLNYQQIYLLKYLRRESPLRVSEIADILRIPIFSATRLIDQLENRDYICRNRDTQDRRNILITISETGLDKVKHIDNHAFSTIATNLLEFSDEEVDSIMALVRSLDTILGTKEIGWSSDKIIKEHRGLSSRKKA